MSDGDSIPSQVFRNALLVASDRVCEARSELCELDAVAGDGDLGVTLATSFAAIHQLVAELDEPDSGAVLTHIGVELSRKAPSTIGALLASAFMRAGRELAGIVEIDAVSVAMMLCAAATAVAERGGAVAGQRTVLDAMDAAAVAAERASSFGAPVAETLELAAAAARAGAEATAEMEPQHGRAAWIGAGARGRPNAGAAAWATYVGGLAEGVANPSET